MSVIDVTDATFDEEVVKSRIPVVIDIWAEWCVSPHSLVLKNKFDSARASDIKTNDTVLAYDGKEDIDSYRLKFGD